MSDSTTVSIMLLPVQFIVVTHNLTIIVILLLLCDYQLLIQLKKCDTENVTPIAVTRL